MKTNKKMPKDSLTLVSATTYPAEASRWQIVDPMDEIQFHQATLVMAELAEEEAYYQNKKTI